MSKGIHIDLFCIGTLTKHRKEYMWKDSEHEFHFGLAVAGFFRHCFSSETSVGDTLVHLLAAFIASRRDTVERSTPLMQEISSEPNWVFDDGPSLPSLTKILQLHTVDKEDCPFAAEVRRMSIGLRTLLPRRFAIEGWMNGWMGRWMDEATRGARHYLTAPPPPSLPPSRRHWDTDAP